MENQSFSEDILLLEGLKLTSQSSLPAFIFLLLIYIFDVVSNISLVSLIFCTKSLHQPMYLLLCNMSINDVFGATIITPHVMRDIFVPPSERHIRYLDCVFQAFCVHLYAGTTYTVLMVMAFDRYVAICNPLRYATIMTNRMVLKLSVGAWTTVLVLVGILIGLSVRLERCRQVILNPFCDNGSLLQLSCEGVLINHIYGLGYTAILLGSSIISVALTYLKIAAVCLRSKNKALNSKALQTCTTHLTVCIFLLATTLIIITLHRFPQLSDPRKTVSVLLEATIPAFNVIVYGLQIKEIKQRIIALFYRNKVAQKK